MNQNSSLKICLKFLAFLAIIFWIYSWFILFWAIPTLVEPSLKLPFKKCIHDTDTSLVACHMVGQEIERVELFTPLGICFCIFKIIQSPLILVLAITLTFVWLYFLIKYAKDVNLSVFMPLFTIPLILTFAEQVLVILLAADLAKSLISIINLVSR